MDNQSERYDAEYFRETFGRDGLQRYSMGWWSARMYARIGAWCLRRTGGKKLLEIGCGQGHVLSFLEDRYETFGVDVSSYAIEQCAQFAPRSQCQVADLEREVPFDDRSFDLVIARYVFEHIPDPSVAIRQAAQLLRPGGALFFAVPNTESLGARRKGSDWYALQDPTHCSLLAPDTWVELTRDAGLSVAREFADGYWDLPYVDWLPGWLQAPFFLGPSACACLAGRPLLPARFGENVMIVADKPAEAAP